MIGARILRCPTRTKQHDTKLTVIVAITGSLLAPLCFIIAVFNFEWGNSGDWRFQLLLDDLNRSCCYGLKKGNRNQEKILTPLPNMPIMGMMLSRAMH